jgi:hypothetical protein
MVLALAALAAGYVYAYKNSEVFRDIVDKVFADVKIAVQGGIDIFNGLLRIINEILDGISSVLAGFAKVAALVPTLSAAPSTAGGSTSASLPGMGGFAPVGVGASGVGGPGSAAGGVASQQVIVHQALHFHGAADPAVVAQAANQGVMMASQSMGMR